MIKVSTIPTKTVSVGIIEQQPNTGIGIMSTIVEVMKDLEHYEGDYEVTPKANRTQTLATANKYLEQNVVVSKVPFYEVSNEKGHTVYIASEV